MDSNFLASGIISMNINDSSILMSGPKRNFNSQFYCWFLLTDIKCCSQPGCDSVDIRWNAVANISTSNKKIIEVSVYPNPTANVVQVYTNINLFLLEVYSSQGIKIISEQAGYTTQINLQNHAAGLYYIRVSKEGVVKTIKVFKE